MKKKRGANRIWWGDLGKRPLGKQEGQRQLGRSDHTSPTVK
jgi:hypothetical protein